MNYEFDAPEYFDLTKSDDETPRLQGLVASTSMDVEKSAIQNEAKVQVKTVISTEEENPVNPREKIDNSPKPPSIQNSKPFNNPTRQSPRLAAIAKSVRRSNASRGFVSTSKCHRRSLSDGAKFSVHFAKVEKKRNVQRKGVLSRPKNVEDGKRTLPQEDENTLRQTSHYQRILSSNRQRSCHIAPSKGPMKSVVAALKPTQPQEFNFATDSRVKSRPKANVGSSVDFPRMLRSHTATTNEMPKGTTKVVPFDLHKSSKSEESSQPFVSLAELNLKFQTQTPQRFRTLKHGADRQVLEPSKKVRTNSGGLTHPHTPQLTTKLRSRSVNHPTRDEIEERELEEAHKHRFKARPLNMKILVEPPIMPAQTSNKTATVPIPFDITDMKKPKDNPTLKILVDASSDLNYSASFLAAAIPHGGIGASYEKKATEVKPFSFDSRDIEMIRRKKEKIQALIKAEQKKAEFHAQPMPFFNSVKGLPPKKPPTPTKVQPFNLQCDIRGSTRQEALQRELEALEEMEKNQRKFVAQPDTVLHKDPFVPHKSSKPLTDISGFSLNTDRRAEERQAFDVHLKEKEDELLAKKKEMEERRRTEEEEEIQRMRKNAIHKAQPVRHYKSVEIKHGIVPPTMPVSPQFLTEQRLKNKTKSMESFSSSMVSVDQGDDTFVMDHYEV